MIVPDVVLITQQSSDAEEYQWFSSDVDGQYCAGLADYR